MNHLRYVHPAKQWKHPERHFLDPTQRVSHQPEVSYPENIETNFSEGQSDK